MDYVFDKNEKNWPTLNQPRVQSDRIVVSMCENGFRAVTNGAPSLGRAVVSGNSYGIQLPGTILDARRMEVSFILTPDRDPQK